MKTQLKKNELSHLIWACENAEHFQWENHLLTAMVHEQTQKLFKQCKAKEKQKKATISATAAEALAVKTLLGAMGPSPSALIITEYFMNPILKQILK